VYGQPVTFTAAVAPVSGTGTPTGTVTFRDSVGPGLTNFGSSTLSGGVATFSISDLTGADFHSVTAAYAGDANFNASTSAALTQTVQSANTITTVTSSMNPSLPGQTVTFTVSVALASPSSGPAGGNVDLTVDQVDEGLLPLNGGSATFSTSSLSAGTHTIFAQFPAPGGNFVYSNQSFTQTVNTPIATTTTLASSANPSVFGEPVTFTASVAAVSGTDTPTGTVTFRSGALFHIATLSGGVATWSTSELRGDFSPYNFTATYGGDTNFTSSTSTALVQTVNPANTMTTITSSMNPSQPGQSVTFTVSVTAVSPGSGMADGGVDFSVDGTEHFLLLNGGSATYSTSSLSAGTHTLIALYQGDKDFGLSIQPFIQTVNTPTATTVTSSANPSVFGQPVTFTATVSAAAPGSGTPTGTVTFSDGLTSIGSGTLSAGIATFSTSSLTVGAHAITAIYSGDTNFAASTSATLDQEVVAAATTTTVASSANPSVFGQPVTFTATVTPIPPGSGTPIGNVTFTVDGSPVSTQPTSDGTATVSLTLNLGDHVIMAAFYSGDTNFGGSTSGAITQTVNQAPTTTILASSANPSVFGQAVTLTATVAPAYGGTPTGTVQFAVDGSNFGGPLALSGGTASINISLTVGTHAITDTYSGDTNFFGASNSITLTVNPAPTTTTVAVSPSTQQYSDLATFTATLSPGTIDGFAPATSVAFSVSYGNGLFLLVGTVFNDGSNTHFSPVPGGTSNITSSWSTAGGMITATLANVPLLADVAGPLASDGSGKMAPGAHTVEAVFGGIDSHFVVGTPTTQLTIAPEDARAFYTGDLVASTAGVTSSTSTVDLSATIKDISAVPGDPAYDPYAGDIRNAVVEFINRDTNTPIATGLPVSLVNPSDRRIGTVQFNWSVNIGSAGSVSHAVGIIVTNYYSRNSSADDTVITISRPQGTGFITGGGYLVASASAGADAATAGSQIGFGFNVKFNQSGTQLQGSFDSSVQSGGKTLDIASNAMTSLAIVGANRNQAIFDAQASLTDITNPTNPISLGSNLTLHVTMTDPTATGSKDTLGITLWNGSQLLFASQWNGTRTVEQSLGGGDVAVHNAQLIAGGAASGPSAASGAGGQLLVAAPASGLDWRTAVESVFTSKPKQPLVPAGTAADSMAQANSSELAKIRQEAIDRVLGKRSVASLSKVLSRNLHITDWVDGE
jgi:hypothetical protein